VAALLLFYVLDSVAGAPTVRRRARLKLFVVAGRSIRRTDDQLLLFSIILPCAVAATTCRYCSPSVSMMMIKVYRQVYITCMIYLTTET